MNENHAATGALASALKGLVPSSLLEEWHSVAAGETDPIVDCHLYEALLQSLPGDEPAFDENVLRLLRGLEKQGYAVRILTPLISGSEQAKIERFFAAHGHDWKIHSNMGGSELFGEFDRRDMGELPKARFLISSEKDFDLEQGAHAFFLTPQALNAA